MGPPVGNGCSTTAVLIALDPCHSAPTSVCPGLASERGGMRDVGRQGPEPRFSASYLYPVDGRRLHGLPVELQTQARSLWGLDPSVSTGADNLLQPVLVSVVGNGLLEVAAQVVRQGQVKICGRYQGASPLRRG